MHMLTKSATSHLLLCKLIRDTSIFFVKKIITNSFINVFDCVLEAACIFRPRLLINTILVLCLFMYGTVYDTQCYTYIYIYIVWWLHLYKVHLLPE